MTTLYPWFQPVWKQLESALARGRLPHALLLTGLAGIGKGDFAKHLARALICESENKPCGSCAACKLYAAGTHPDYFHVHREINEKTGKQSRTIKIEQVRKLSEKLVLSCHGAGHKVAIIDPADAMTREAANSLLKTLEEPSDNTVLVLVSSRPARLPATVRSRCQWLRLETGDGRLALDWLSDKIGQSDAMTCLNLSAGAPLAAHEMAVSGSLDMRTEYFKSLVAILQGSENAISVAGAWYKDEEMQGLRWVHGWLSDLARLKMGGLQDDIRNIDLVDDLQKLARQVSIRKIFALMDKVAVTLNRGSGSLNQQLMTEDILLSWAELTEQAA